VSDQPQRVAFDCNIFAQALLNPLGPAGACVNAAIDGRVRLFISEYVLEEIRDIPNKPTPRKAGITPQKAESLIVLIVAVRLPIRAGLDRPLQLLLRFASQMSLNERENSVAMHNVFNRHPMSPGSKEQHPFFVISTLINQMTLWRGTARVAYQ
jgi:hypothetical protein